MKTQSILATLIIMISLFSFSHASTINAPTQISSNVNWAFSVSLDSGNTDVFLDGKKIVSYYSNGQTVIDPFGGSFVLNAFVIDHTLYISYMGVPKGTYEIEATGAEKFFVDIFNPLSDEIESDINTKLEEATGDNEKTLAQINTLEQDLLAEKERLTEKENEINSLRSDLEKANNRIEKLDLQIKTDSATLTGNLTEITSRLAEVETEVFPEPILLEETESGMISGFYTLAKEHSNWIGWFLILVVSFFAIGLFARKKFLNPTSVFDDFDSSQSTEPSESSEEEIEEDEEEDPEDDEEKEEDSTQKSKWAFKN